MLQEHTHLVLGTPVLGPYPPMSEKAVFALGCFWGAERIFWKLPGMWTTYAAYAGGDTENPTYEEVCTGRTNHTEAVVVVYDPTLISYEKLLSVFWENHDPTQYMRQGNDQGSQYRSAIFTTSLEQEDMVTRSKEMFQNLLTDHHKGQIITEIAPLKKLYPAEAYHQQYLARNPNGYCHDTGLGISCPVGFLN